MINIEYERYYHCDTNSSWFHRDGDVIAPLAVIHHMPNDIECFYIPFIDEPDIEEKGIYGYYISMYEPKYVIETKNKLTKDMKESLMRILNNGGWEKLIADISLDNFLKLLLIIYYYQNNENKIKRGLLLSLFFKKY